MDDILQEYSDITLGRENYKIEIILGGVTETTQNLNSGNIYISAIFKS